ncbi:MAG: hypothetical protein A4E59_00637 [Syntrophorhabdus sp. PtaB.Bin027]|nr:MAG: hypothetical protein A4E59_00637 [Syntrophorhabdus sp. PtaB.Bin027]
MIIMMLRPGHKTRLIMVRRDLSRNLRQRWYIIILLKVSNGYSHWDLQIFNPFLYTVIHMD